jgi:cell division protein FtsB
MADTAVAPSATWNHKELWTTYQELSQLSEEKQRALAQLAQRSNSEETEHLILAVKAVYEKSQAIIEGLKAALVVRTAVTVRIWRAFGGALGLCAADIELLATINDLNCEAILEKVYVLSAVDIQIVQAMVAQAPQAKTKDLEELLCRFEKINTDLKTFITLLEDTKAAEGTKTDGEASHSGCTIV